MPAVIGANPFARTNATVRASEVIVALTGAISTQSVATAVIRAHMLAAIIGTKAFKAVTCAISTQPVATAVEPQGFVPTRAVANRAIVPTPAEVAETTAVKTRALHTFWMAIQHSRRVVSFRCMVTGNREVC
jgi:hypothetical protein